MIVSGFLDDEAKARAEKAGADICLAKPVRPPQLLEAVAELLPSASVARD